MQEYIKFYGYSENEHKVPAAMKPEQRDKGYRKLCDRPRVYRGFALHPRQKHTRWVCHRVIVPLSFFNYPDGAVAAAKGNTEYCESAQKSE